MNTANGARALLLAALFGSAAAAAFPDSSCLGCHGNATTMQALVIPPSGGSAEGEG